MALNPHWNRYNVAPVNGIIIIGHRRAMHSGLTRENAINLLAWLTIATEATAEEIAREMEQAMQDTPAAVSPALERDRRTQEAAALKVATRDGKAVIEVPAVRVVPDIKKVDEGRVRAQWRVPLNATGTDGTGSEGEG